MIPGQDSAGECDLLFVYGTLRRGFRLHHLLANLEVSFLAEGKVAGELFDLGEYPGARPSNREGKWVIGELLQLRNPASDLNCLDAVEEFIPAAPERSQFIRALAQVILRSGGRERAWIYWLSARLPTGCQRIASGDYAAWRPRD